MTPRQRLLLIKLFSDTRRTQPTHAQALARLRGIYEEVTAVLQPDAPTTDDESDNDDEN